jgi:NAD(P)H-dependent FMN reductase
MGGIRTGYQLQQIILSISGYPKAQMLIAAQMDKQLDENENVINESFNKSLERLLTAFLGFTERF